MGIDFVSLGEVMVQLNPVTPGPIRYCKYFEVHVAGAEANTLIGLQRLGYKTGLITKVGNDEFGKLIINTLKAEGVDISRVSIDDEAPTGVYFIQRHFPIPGQSTVFYYRHNSAASKLSKDDIDEYFITSAHTLYLTGITPSLSFSCLEATEKAFLIAKRSGMKVIFDTNIRMKLWRESNRARKAISKFLSSDIIFTNPEDISILFPNISINEGARNLINRGAKMVVIKLGPKGSMVLTKERTYQLNAYKVPFVEDPIGAGDAFNAAFIASIYKGLTIEEALENANAAGALVVTVRGDIEALPTWHELEIFKQSLKKTFLLR